MRRFSFTLRKASLFASMPAVAAACLTTTTTTTVAAGASTASTGAFSATRCLLKDIGRPDRGDSRRLTFDERSERRAGKTKDQKDAGELKRQEAEEFVSTEFPQGLQTIFEKTEELCQNSHMKIVNMLKFLERLEIEVVPGKVMLLLQLATLVKVTSSEMELTLSHQRTYR